MLRALSAPRWWTPVSAALLIGLACGPSIELETDSGASGDASESNGSVSESESADDTAGVEVGCGVGDTQTLGGGAPGPTGFPPPCIPKNDPGTNGYVCCSDDPAAANGLRPNYDGMNIPNSDVPYFSEGNNSLSTSGMCVRVGDLVGQGLQGGGVADCPIPCNPTWAADWIDDVCGPARVCCQTVELQPADCIQDAQTGLFRPVTGDDIGVSTMWRPADHSTHQDPNGNSCLALAGNDSSSSLFQDCVRQLTVANQRGFCMALGSGQVCPTDVPDYTDACEMLNGG